jgi:hypothetical protein
MDAEDASETLAELAIDNVPVAEGDEDLDSSEDADKENGA